MAARQRPLSLRDPGPDRGIGEQLADWGKVALLETRGRTSGRPARTAVGFVEHPDGTLVLAAGSAGADWVRNLRAEPECSVRIGERHARYLAREVEGADHSAAVVELILKYGTPAEGLGHGPVFRLIPA